MNEIKSGLSYLKDDIENMSEDEKRIEELAKMVDFNKQNQKGEGPKKLKSKKKKKLKQ